MFFKGSKEDIILEEGMCFTIEPMINVGGWKASVCKKDKWTAKTKDDSLSAQFEHTIGVEKNGCKIFTKSKNGLDYPPELKSFNI
jgi:methionyl aminopeptidase